MPNLKKKPGGSWGAKTALTGAVAVLLLLSAVPVRSAHASDTSEPLAQPLLPMVRAMGGAFTAVANDENAVFYNPAGYALVKDDVVSVFSLGMKINVDNSALKLYSALLSGVDVTASGNLDAYLSDTTVAPGLTGPIYLSRVGDNFGFAFYDAVSVVMDTRPGALLPYASLFACADLGFVGGYGTSLGFLPGVYAGANIKVLLRSKSFVEGTVLDVIDQMSDGSTIPFSKAVGFGGDLGMLYFPSPRLSVGLCVKDFFGTRFSTWETLNNSTPFGRSLIKPRAALGIAVYPAVTGGAANTFRNLIIALDYSDLFDYTSVFSNIKLGVSFETLKIITVRSGIDGGYPTFGLGFDLNVIQLQTAYFVDEMGAYTGSHPVQNVMLNIALNW
jgi:hypothetical protein